jgi:hypothetical protein
MVETTSPMAAARTRMKDVARGGSQRVEMLRYSGGVTHHMSRVYVKVRAVERMALVTLDTTVSLVFEYVSW